MKTQLLSFLVIALSTASSALATTVYNNTTTPTPALYLYSVGPYRQIGDTIALGGTDRILTSATVQFFNLGSAGSFDATLRFWNVGSPVGSQIGTSYVTPVSIGELQELNVTFTDLNVLVPNNLVFTIGISDWSPGIDVGLSAYEPPSFGSSNDSEIITRLNSGSFSADLSAAQEGNLFLRLEATSVPIHRSPRS
jgi:hypothetical protein